MLVRYATAFVLLPGGLGTLDEFFETILLIQTHKIHPFPVILVGSDYWSRLLEWMKEVVLQWGYISPEDMDIFRLVDNPKEAVEKIISWYDEHQREFVMI